MAGQTFMAARPWFERIAWIAVLCDCQPLYLMVVALPRDIVDTTRSRQTGAFFALGDTDDLVSILLLSLRYVCAVSARMYDADGRQVSGDSLHV